MSDKLRKKLFFAVVIVNYLMVAIYEFLTPYMSDDIIYIDEVAKANSVFDLFVQEYDQYMYHGGRSVAHMIMRIFMFIGSKPFFNLMAGVTFVALSLLIYVNIDHRKKYDIRMYIGIAILFWVFEPTISNTVLWMTGACNYLFTSTLIFGYFTLYRKSFAREKDGNVLFALGMLIWGLLAGWCNENSSGGVLLLTLMLLFAKYVRTKKLSFIKPWMITGIIGNMSGILLMILSPGNKNRAGAAEEAHTGLLALAARFLKITLNIKNNYLILILLLIVLMIAIAYKTGSFSRFIEASATEFLFGIAFFATCYALIAVKYTELRAYYCASLFLMTAIMNALAWIVNVGFEDELVQILLTSLVTVLSVILLFTYIEQGANLARIKREIDERDMYLTRCALNGEHVVEAPMLRPDWENKYSMAYISDVTEDKFFSLNMFYAEHYGLWYIIGVERESWTGY